MRYGFGEYVLDTDRYELRRQGTPVSLAPQAFKLLTYLLEHRDRMVTKEELHEQVWQSKYVADAALTTCIATVRQALEDRRHQCIKRCTGGATASPPPYASSRGRRRMWQPRCSQTRRSPSSGQPRAGARLLPSGAT